MELFIRVTFLVGLTLANTKIEKGNKEPLASLNSLKILEAQVAEKIRVCPYCEKSICRLHAILRYGGNDQIRRAIIRTSANCLTNEIERKATV